MAKFDVYRLTSEGSYVLDCQADLLGDLDTRLVVALWPLADAPRPLRRLNPILDIVGEPYVMMTQVAATIPVSDLREHIVSLESEWLAIGNALDMLISGY